MSAESAAGRNLQATDRPDPGKLDDILVHIGAHTAREAIRTSRDRCQAMVLPDEFARGLAMLRSRDEGQIPAFIDQRMECWHGLVGQGRPLP